MNTLGWLIKREYWEHRGGMLWTPIWVGVATLAITLLGIISAEVLGGRVQTGGLQWSMLTRSLGADDLAKAGAGLDVTYLMIIGLLAITLFFVLFFYLLGTLYDDRRDRSVLFWKSLPVSDSSSVLAKVLVATLLAPLLSFAVATVIYIALIVLMSVWIGVHGVNPWPAIAASNPIGIAGRVLMMIPVNALWALPCVGWLLLCSAWARSKPFLWAALVPLIALVANAWSGMLGLPHVATATMLKHGVGRILFSILPGSFWSGGTELNLSDNQQPGELLHQLDPSVTWQVMGTSELWIGVVVGIGLIVLASWMRQRRIETST